MSSVDVKTVPVLDPRFSGFKLDQVANKLRDVLNLVKDFELLYKGLTESERAAFGGITINALCIWSDFAVLAEYGNVITLNYLDQIAFENHNKFRGKPLPEKPLIKSSLITGSNNGTDRVIN